MIFRGSSSTVAYLDVELDMFVASEEFSRDDVREAIENRGKIGSRSEAWGSMLCSSSRDFMFCTTTSTSLTLQTPLRRLQTAPGINSASA